jgi:CBS domain-containing protein
MFIRNALTDFKELTVVYPEDTISEVLSKMEGHLSLPCVESNHTFLGFISKRTVFECFQASDMTFADFSQQSAKTCIDSDVRTLHLNDYFEQTIDIIIRQPFVPIVENDKLIGIVKRGDINHALSIAFATDVECHRILLGMAEVEGALQRLFAITHRLGINVITAVPFDASKDALNRRLILKVSKNPKFDILCDTLEKSGFLLMDVSR